MVSVCTELELANEAKSAHVQSALMSVVRFHGVHKGNWDYEGAEEDLPRYAAFVEALALPARNFIRQRYFRAPWSPISTLVQGLLIGGRALGVEGATRDSDYAALVNTLFAPSLDPGPLDANATSAEDDPTDWIGFTNALRKCRRLGEREDREKPSWQWHLLNLTGARQGQAEHVHAIDALRIKAAIESTLGAWEFDGTLPNPTGVSDFAVFRATFTELKKLSSAVKKAQRRYFSWRNDFLVWLGDGTDKDVLVRELKETVDAARAAGLAVGIETRRLLELVEDFRNAKVFAALEDAAKLDEGAPRGTVLSILGRGYDSVLRICEEMQKRFEEFFGSIEAELASQSVKYGQDPLAEAEASLAKELDETKQLLEGLQKHDIAGPLSRPAQTN